MEEALATDQARELVEFSRLSYVSSFQKELLIVTRILCNESENRLLSLGSLLQKSLRKLRKLNRKLASFEVS
jgi:hypothetical protein